MNEQEKKAIEEIGLIIESFYDFPNSISIDLKDKDVKLLETVLNLIQTQQIKLENKDKIIDEMATLVFMSRNLTFVDEEQFSARKREIIEYAEEQATAKGAI